jgi:hypothetical protein
LNYKLQLYEALLCWTLILAKRQFSNKRRSNKSCGTVSDAKMIVKVNVKISAAFRLGRRGILTKGEGSVTLAKEA